MKRALTWIGFLCLAAAWSLGAQANDALQLRPGVGPRPGEITYVQASFQVGGELKLAVPGKPDRSLPMSVAANLEYAERFLSTPTDQSGALRSLRHYAVAQATLKVDKGGEKPALPNARKLIAAQIDEGAAILYCPSGPLTREELDLIDVPGSSLILPQLLPTRSASVGTTWRHDDQCIGPLLGLDVVSSSDVKSMLNAIEHGTAKVVMDGHVSGAVGGVGTEIEVKAKYHVDVKSNRITWFALLIKEKRASGPLNPGVDVVAKLVMKLSPRMQSQCLTDRVVANLPKSPTPKNLALSYQSRTGQFEFRYPRDWYITGDDGDLVVLRYADRGDLIGQCNVTLLKPADQRKPITLADFQHDIEQTLAKNFEQFVSANEWTSSEGVRVYRAACRGRSAGLPVQWMYYLLTSEQGRRLNCAFTVEDRLADKFEGADKELVSQIRFVTTPEQSPTTAARPSKAQ